MKNMIDAQLENLILDLKKNTKVRGVQKQITDAIRNVTQDNQVYTITKKTQEVFNSYGLNIPSHITHSKRQKWSNLLKKTNYPKEYLVNQSFLNIEHWKMIQDMKKELLEMTLPSDTTEAVEVLKKYFIENTRCFIKLSFEEDGLQSREGVNWDVASSKLVDPSKAYFVV
jgi:hypothetical protein